MKLRFGNFDKKRDDSDIWASVGILKRNGVDYKDKIFNGNRMSYKKLRYPKNRGYWAINREAPAVTDLRMHGLYQIDHFPSPVYQNDDQTFREYIEM